MSITFTSHAGFRAELDDVMSRLEEVEQRARALDAERIQLLAEAFDLASAQSDDDFAMTPEGPSGEMAYRTIRAEIALGLRLSEATIDRKITQSHLLSLYYPNVLGALEQGLVNERHVSTIVDAAEVIGLSDAPEAEARRASFETAILPIAERETPNRLRPIARQLAEQFAQVPLDERHDRAREDRRVILVERDHGMSDLIAHLPTGEAQAAFSRLTKAARELTRIERAHALQQPTSPAGHDATAEQPLTPRTRDQARADILLALLTDDANANIDDHLNINESVNIDDSVNINETCANANVNSPRRPSDLDRYGLRRVTGVVQIIVTDETLFAEDQTLPLTAHGRPSALAPPELVGAGPISSAEAKKIASEAEHWLLIRQNHSTGEVLRVDRYRPSTQMRRLLGARDVHCRFPGCRVPVTRCDLDHTIAAEHGGPTSSDNLAHLCRGHHTLKHHGGWSVDQRGDGTLAWRSPTGRNYQDRPPSRVRFAHATAHKHAHRSSARFAEGWQSERGTTSTGDSTSTGSTTSTHRTTSTGSATSTHRTTKPPTPTGQHPPY